jgi:3-dehydrosphinganine reductase
MGRPRIKSFDGKRIYIFGGSSGIGLSTAVLLAAEGADIAIFGRSRKRLKDAVRRISHETLRKKQSVLLFPLDVSQPQAVASVLANAVKTFGVPDVLINSAGRAFPHYFEDVTCARFDDTIKTNLYGTFHTISVLLPFMKENGGIIANVSSIAGFVGVFGLTDYCASKFAVIGFSEALKSEVAKHNISVSVLCPPDTDTPGFEVENRTKPEETRAISEGAGLMQPEMVAARFVKELKAGEFMIIPGMDGRFTNLAKRFFPGVVDFMMARTVKRVQNLTSR